MNDDVLNYTYHEEFDIHEFNPQASSREVVISFIRIVHKIIANTVEDKKSCALIIWNLKDAEIFPLRLQQAYFQRLLKQYQQIPPAYILYLTNRSSDDALIRTHYTNTRDTRKVFRLEQRNQGIKWLLGCRG